jgi:indole-3-acetate monooxygenase
MVGLGVACRALDEVHAMAGTRRSITGGPSLSDRAHVQITLAKAEARLRSARAFLHETADEAYERGIFMNHPLAWALQDALVVPQHALVPEGTWQERGTIAARPGHGCSISLRRPSRVSVPASP